MSQVPPSPQRVETNTELIIYDNTLLPAHEVRATFLLLKAKFVLPLGILRHPKKGITIFNNVTNESIYWKGIDSKRILK